MPDGKAHHLRIGVIANNESYRNLHKKKNGESKIRKFRRKITKIALEEKEFFVEIARQSPRWREQLTE